MFTYVNELAVIATALFMVAVAMIWYSQYLFLRSWLRSVGLTQADVERAASHMKRNIAITFLSYVIVVFFIALAIGYAQVHDVPVQYIALAVTAGFSALLAGFVVWEQRPLNYFLITAGFAAVFVVGSTFLLYYWPW